MSFERHVPLEGANNFRDFGGYAAADGRTVKWRRLFRSDRLSSLTEADCAALAAFGIRFVYDLRRDSEAAASPTRWTGEAPPELIRSPIFADETGRNSLSRLFAREGRCDTDLARQVMTETYVRMVSEPHSLASLGRIFTRLSSGDAFPALFHCSAGKDRTGVTCALVLSALGVAREDIVADFMLTQRYYDARAILEHNLTQAVTVGAADWDKEAILPIFGVEPRYIEAALDVVEDAGGAERFLADALGAPAGAVEKLREQLLD
jgi:protein-tyrosine phosphatase